MNFENLEKYGYQEEINNSSDKIIKSIEKYFEEIYKVDMTLLYPDKNTNEYEITLSKKYGYQEFPLHTDGANIKIPPRWVILEYKGSYKSKTCTTILDTRKLQGQKDLEDFFYNDIYIVPNKYGSILTPIVNKILYKKPIMRWNSLIMKKLHSKDNHKNDVFMISDTQKISWEISKILIIDNWRMLHGREQINQIEKNERILIRYNLTPLI